MGGIKDESASKYSMNYLYVTHFCYNLGPVGETALLAGSQRILSAVCVCALRENECYYIDLRRAQCGVQADPGGNSYAPLT